MAKLGQALDELMRATLAPQGLAVVTWPWDGPTNPAAVVSRGLPPGSSGELPPVSQSSLHEAWQARRPVLRVRQRELLSAQTPSILRLDLGGILCAPVVLGDDTPVVLYLQWPVAFPGDAATAHAAARVVVEGIAGWAPDLQPLRRRVRGNSPVERRIQELRLDDLIVGRSAALGQLVDLVRIFASGNRTVMVLGPTGSGKSHLAAAIHRLSARTGKLVRVNCAGLTAELAWSTLFGHVKGAFSGAVTDREGAVKAAHRGTLFLDEVGELPVLVQAQLLTFLDSGESTPLGSDRPAQSDVRIVAATNRDIEGPVEAGRFRKDLYHRLRQRKVVVPPLAERRADVHPLAEAFAARYFGAPARGPVLDPGAVELLEGMDWPGNIRELQWVVDQAAELAAVERVDARRGKPGRAAVPESGEVPSVRADHVLGACRIQGVCVPSVPPTGAGALDEVSGALSDFDRAMAQLALGQVINLHEVVRNTRDALVERAMRAAGNVQAQAAIRLGVSRQSVSDLLKGTE